MKTKFRAAGFSKDRVRELFKLIERSVAHEVNVTRICVYNVAATALTIFHDL